MYWSSKQKVKIQSNIEVTSCYKIFAFYSLNRVQRQTSSSSSDMHPCWFNVNQHNKRTLNLSNGEGFLLENGGLILEKLITSFNGKRSPLCIFSYQDLETATNNYSPDMILHKSFTYLLYRGIWQGDFISVKKFTGGWAHNYIGWYINEVAVASQVSKHNNVLKLLGYCVETEVPTLVYEYAGNGTLSDRVFDCRLPLPWESRLKIVTEIANAVTYLHIGTSKPIIHRDITPGNILLDKDFAAKLFGCGLAVSIPLGETHVDAEVVGSIGYVAPESHDTGRFTEKSDVYSVGAVLFEIFTRKGAVTSISNNEFMMGTNLNGSTLFRTHGYSSDEREKEAASYLKNNIIKEGNSKQLMECAQLTLRCLNRNPDERPSMKEVAKTLIQIKALHNPTS